MLCGGSESVSVGVSRQSLRETASVYRRPHQACLPLGDPLLGKDYVANGVFWSQAHVDITVAQPSAADRGQRHEPGVLAQREVHAVRGPAQARAVVLKLRQRLQTRRSCDEGRMETTARTSWRSLHRRVATRTPRT